MAAKRKRDHKAEYQRRKAIAQQSGFGSVRRYKTARKTLSLPRSTHISIPRIRRESLIWSADHSRVKSSRYSPDFTDDQVISYYGAYVSKSSRDNKNAKLRRLRKYLVGQGLVTETEWIENYVMAQYSNPTN